MIDDPFEGKDATYGLALLYPPRSPSPRKPAVVTDLKDLDVGDTFLEDDIDLEMMKS